VELSISNHRVLIAAVAAAAGIASLAAAPAQAAITVIGDPADAQVQLNGGVSPTFASMRTGTSSSLTAVNVVLVFRLPALPAGETLSGAALDYNFTGLSALPTFNADLYGLAARAASTVLGSDFYEGGLQTGTGVTLIQDNALVPTSPTGTSSTNPTGAANLLTYLTSQYQAAGAGSYVFLRFNGDYDPTARPTGSIGYNIAASNESTLPALNLTTTAVPEPASVGLIGLAGLTLAARRRRS
jgi:hypothetical protein